MSTQTIEIIDKAIENAASFQSITVNDEGTTKNQDISSLVKARETLLQEEELRSGRRATFSTFDMSEQNF